MRVVLGNVFYSSQTNFLSQSLSLGYISAVLEKAGHKTCIVDGSFENLTFDQFVQRVMDFNPDILGMALFGETLEEATKTINYLKAKKPELFVCVGGMYASNSYKTLLDEEKKIDAVVLFDGEINMLNLVNAIENHEDYTELDGIACRKNGTIRAVPAPPIADLDILPYPVRDNSRESGVFTMVGSRGCYGSCKFCSIYSFYKEAHAPKIRVRDPHKIVDEVEFLYKTYDIKEIWFSDANFCSPNTIYPNWSQTIADELIRKNIKILFNILARADDIEYELFKRLKEAGLRTVFIGIESSLQRVLDMFNKFNTVEDNVRAIEIMQKLKINILIGYILYEPLVSLGELKEHYNFFKQSNFYNFFCFDKPITKRNRLILYPGVPIYELCASEGLITHTNAYGYIFKDQRVEDIWNVLEKKWHNHPYFTQYPFGTILRILSHRGLIKFSFQLTRIARAFTSEDMALFLRLIELYETNGSPDPAEIEKAIQLSKEKVDGLIPQLNEIRDYIQEELGIFLSPREATLQHF